MAILRSFSIAEAVPLIDISSVALADHKPDY
jgi:hypothetical protein